MLLVTHHMAPAVFACGINSQAAKTNSSFLYETYLVPKHLQLCAETFEFG